MTQLNRTDDMFRSDSAQGRVRETGIYIGVVKGNADPQRMGRLAVYIPELGGDPEDAKTWFTVGYASPFAGATDIEKNADSGSAKDEMAGTQKSYGWWGVPPDVNNQVLVCFVNGDTARGYWFACLYQQFMNHMVPGLALNRSTKPDINAQNLPPVCEYNRKDKDINVWDPPRPIFEPLYEGLRQQGLFTDPERGPATTSARRESPSKVMGFISPRGNSIHIDDIEDNEFIRLRTRSGVGITIHETTGYIYMISKKGDSWMEISDEGIDMYSKRSINMRAEENINMHADQNILSNGAGAMHSRAGNHTMASEGGSSTEVKGDSSRKVGGTSSTDAQGGINRNGPKILDAGNPAQLGAFGANGVTTTGNAATTANTSAGVKNGAFSTSPSGIGTAGDQGSRIPGSPSTGTPGDGGSGSDGGSGGGSGAQASSNKPLAYGDSIANGVAGKGGYDGQTKVGVPPKTVLGYINDADPASFKDRTVVLSSGLSNNPNDRATVVAQVDKLQSMGANVILMGAAPGIKNDANNWLQGFASQRGIGFQDLGAISKDGIHPANYQNIVNQINRR